MSGTKSIKNIQIFRSSDGATLNETDAMKWINITGPVKEGLEEAMENGIENGQELRVLFRGFGISLAYVYFKPGYPLPLHKHNSDCLYYIIAGSIQLGRETLGKGDGFFLKANTGYTYSIGDAGVELLEFRPTEKFTIEFMSQNPDYWAKLGQQVMDNQEAWQQDVKPSDEFL